jgi:hypothetical protein
MGWITLKIPNVINKPPMNENQTDLMWIDLPIYKIIKANDMNKTIINL